MVWCLDFEVFSHDFLVVFKQVNRDNWRVFHNDNYAVKSFINEKDRIYTGFNIKHYDQFCLRAVLLGADPRLVKEINDFIIVCGYNGWQHHLFQTNKSQYLKLFDLMDDMQMGLSLKTIEGHLGLPIRESTVPFDIDRPLTNGELEEVIEYCKYDVLMVEKLLELRKNYLRTKLELGRRFGLEDHEALYCTNAKITAKILKADAKPRLDERNYQIPERIKPEWLPREVVDFYARLADPTLTEGDVFKETIVVSLAPQVEITYGFGGVHQGLEKYQEESEEQMCG